jgi:GNAT superfamily N-acetyltransferase
MAGTRQPRSRDLEGAMTPRSQLLLAVFAAAAQRPDPKPSPALLVAIDRVDGVTGDRSREEEEQMFWDVFQSEYGIFFAASASRDTHSPNDESKWADLLGWIIAELRTWPGQGDPRPRRLQTILAITRTMDWDNTFWPALPDDIGANERFVAALVNNIQTARIELSSGFGTRPSAAGMIKKFNIADVDGDWVVLGEMYPWIFDYTDAPIYAQAVRCLHRFNFSALAVATNTITRTSAAGIVAGALNADDSLKLGKESTSLHQKFCCTFRGLYRREPLSNDAQQNLTDILVQVAADPSTWRAWMAVFNTYPSRFPTLQAPLGVALASIDLLGIAAYVDSLRLQVMPQGERAQVAQCLRAFRDLADPSKRQTLWAAAAMRWQNWDFGRLDTDSYLMEVSGSVLDYAIVGYFVECVAADERDCRIKGILSNINLVDREWHPSLPHCIAARNRQLSRMQPLVHAGKIIGKGQDWLHEDQRYTIDAGAANHYFELKYRVQLMQPSVDTRSPADYTEAELGAFEKLVGSSNEVDSSGLPARVRSAEWLFQLKKGNIVIGVAALKCPAPNYRQHVADQSGVPLPANKFPYEFGWLYVLPEENGHRYSRLIINAAVEKAEGAGIFATCRQLNEAMHHILPQHGFVRSGSSYRSTRGAYDLVAFVRPASSSVAVPWP